MSKMGVVVMLQSVGIMVSSLGAFISSKRAESGLTQGDVAKQLNAFGYKYGATAISTWENEGKRPPIDDPDFAAALAVALGTTQLELYRAVGMLPKVPQITRQAISAMLEDATEEDLDDFEAYLRFKLASRKKRKGG